MGATRAQNDEDAASLGYEPGRVAVEFGAKLRAARSAQGVGLRDLARRLDVAHGHLSLIEQGKAKPSRDLVEQIQAKGGLGVELLSVYPALADEWKAKSQQRTRLRRRLAEQEGARAGGRASRAASSGKNGTNTQSPRYPDATNASEQRDDGAEGETNRREAVKTIGALLLGGASRARSLLRSVEYSNVGPLTLDEYDEAVEFLTRHAHVKPVVPLMRKADQVTAEVTDLLLQGKHSGKHRMRLELLAGQLSYLQGDFAFRLGDYSVARSHLRVAHHYGEQLGNDVLLASVANVEAYLGLYQGRFEKALTIVRQARQHATAHTSARLATLEARALAGARPSAHEELGDLLDRAEAAMPAEPSFEPGAVAPFGPEMLAFHGAVVSVRARHQRAGEFAREAVSQYEAMAADKSERFAHAHLALSRLDLATALVQSKPAEPREAARLGVQALALPQQLHEDTVKRRAGELLAVLSNSPAWRSLPAVREFGEAVRSYGPRALSGLSARPGLTRS